MRRVSIMALLLALAVAAPALSDPLGLVPGYDDPQPAFSWQGAWQSKPVYFRSMASGAQLYGTVFAPAHPQPGQRYPFILILPGSTVGVQAQYQWSARDLAGHGYIALTIDPRGAGKSGEDAQDPCGPGAPSPSCVTTRNNANPPDYIDAIRSGLAFGLSSQDPYSQLIDPSKIGAAGHSEGADVLSYLQSIQPQLKAIVAWDNLISSTTGDQGNANCNNKPTIPIVPRVPALGEASETCQQLVGPNAKKTGYEHWRTAGLPSMEVVFAGTQHTQFAQEDNTPSAGTATGSEQQLHDFEYYTRAWFDLFLKHDRTAASRLLAATVNGRPRSEILSSQSLSASYLPAYGVNCENLALCRLPHQPRHPGVVLSGSQLPVLPNGQAQVPVSCRSAARRTCHGRITLYLNRRRIGRARFTMPSGSTTLVATVVQRPIFLELRNGATLRSRVVATGTSLIRSTVNLSFEDPSRS